MALIIGAYVILSLVAGVTAMFTTGFWSGAALIAGAALSLSIISGVRATLFGYENGSRIGYFIGSAVVIALIVWLSQKFQFALFGLTMPGWQWCVIGAGLIAVYSSIDRDTRWTDAD